MSNYDENVTTEYLYNEPLNAAEEPVAAERGTEVYRILSVILFIIALGGLFIGMLTSAWSAFKQADIWSAYNLKLGPSTFSMCFMGMLVAIFNSISSLKVDTGSVSMDTWYWLNILLVFFIVFAAIFALIFMIVALCTKSKDLARNSAFVSGILSFLSYGGYFLFAYSLTGVCDAPSAAIAALVLLVLVVTAIVRRKSFGILSALLLILTVICIMMLNYPKASVSKTMSLLVFDLYKADLFLGIALTFLVAILALNFFITTIRLDCKRSYDFDAIRYGIQLFAVVLTIIAFMVSKNFGTWDIFSANGQTLATVLLLLCSIAAFVVALLEALLARKKVEEMNNTNEIVVTGRQQPVTHVYEPAYIRVAPVESYAPYVQPVVVTQPPVQQVVQPQPQVQVHVQPPQPQPQPQQPAETRIYVQHPEKPEVPYTEFERRMQALARGEVSVYDASPVPVAQKNQEISQTYVKEQHKYKRRGEDMNGAYVYDGAQYVYDPFIKTLNVQERNEFGDLFIANIYGLRSYLPTYVIGGDNKMFFDRVFIYLGCYRNYISQELLEKIYLYVSKQ